MIKLVVFDLDGTLVNSVYDLADAVNNVLKRNGYKTHQLEKFYHFVGNGTKLLVKRALPENTSDELVEKLHNEFLDEYSKHCLDKTIPYDGIENMLYELSKRNIKLAVASNKTDEFTKEIVSKLFSKYNFFDASGFVEGVPKKPSPEIVLNILNKANVSNDEVLYVGDSDVDVQTGHNAKLLVCGCEWGFRGRKELLNAGCDYLLEKPSDLLDIILNFE